MAFITNKAQIKEANSSVTVDLSLESLRSFLADAEDKFRPIFGVASFTELESKTTELAYKKMAAAIVNMALHLYANSGQLLVSDSGMHVSKSNSTLPASDKKIVAFKRGVFKKAWECFEACLSLMDAKPLEFPIWHASAEYKLYFNSFISYTSTFNYDSRIAVTPDMFQVLRAEIRAVERDQIIPLMGLDVYADLLDKFNSNGAMSPIEDVAITYAKKAITSLSLAGCIPYLMVEVTANGVFQLSEAALSSQSDNIEAKNVPQARALQRTMNRLITVGEGELETLRIFMNDNASAFAGYKMQEIAPMASINDGLNDSNVYFL